MIELTRAKIVRDCVVLHAFDLPRICGDCDTYFPTRVHKCSECHQYNLEMACSVCRVPLERQWVKYSVRSPRDVHVSQAYPADQCPSCAQLFLSDRWPAELDELSKIAPAGFRIVPEHGFQSAKEIEVFSFIGPADIYNVGEIKRRNGGVEIRYGERSRFFRDHADYFTELDLGDYGLEESPTIRIRPAPPYNPSQLLSLRILLAKLQIAIFEKDDAECEDDIPLLRAMLKWKERRDARGLALASAIRNRSHPGRLVNAYRMLELVLKRLLDAEIGRRRRDTATDDELFIELASTHRMDLKTRLRRRVEGLDTPPDSVLREMWRAINPGLAFDERAVFGAIATFRNRQVHRPAAGSTGLLPWDEPDFELIASLLLQLIVYLLKHDPGGC